MQKLQLLQNQFNPTSDDIFYHIVQAPPDPIFGIANAYKADTSNTKIDLGVGAYRTDEEKPYVFEIIKKLEKEIVNDPTLNKEYLPIEGLADFNKGCQKLMFGQNSPLIASGQIVTAQCLGGTGALRVGFEFVKRHIPGDVYVSKPTWSNHNQVIERAGLNQFEYPYYEPKTKGFNCAGTIECLSQARMGSIVLLHVLFFKLKIQLQFQEYLNQRFLVYSYLTPIFLFLELNTEIIQCFSCQNQFQILCKQLAIFQKKYLIIQYFRQP